MSWDLCFHVAYLNSRRRWRSGTSSFVVLVVCSLCRCSGFLTSPLARLQTRAAGCWRNSRFNVRPTTITRIARVAGMISSLFVLATWTIFQSSEACWSHDNLLSLSNFSPFTKVGASSSMARVVAVVASCIGVVIESAPQPLWVGLRACNLGCCENNKTIP